MYDGNCAATDGTVKERGVSEEATVLEDEAHSLIGEEPCINIRLCYLALITSPRSL